MGQVMEGLGGLQKEVSMYPVTNNMPLKDLICWVRLALQKNHPVRDVKKSVGMRERVCGERERERVDWCQWQQLSIYNNTGNKNPCRPGKYLPKKN